MKEFTLLKKGKPLSVVALKSSMSQRSKRYREKAEGERLTHKQSEFLAVSKECERFAGLLDRVEIIEMADRNFGLGHRLTEARVKLNITQEDLGDLVGCHKNSILRWENGSVMPRADQIPELCRALGCSADYLLGLGDK